MTTGLMFGKFAPLHNGHISAINQAATRCDHLTVVLVYDQKWLNTLSPYLQKRLSFKNRLRWLKQTFQDLPHISVTWVDETPIAEYPNGWPAFANLILDKLPLDYNRKIDFVFSSEPDYSDGIKKWLKATPIVVDNERTFVPISATTIRHDIYKNWGYLPSRVRSEFVFKVCIMGTESCGKTTLTKYLAKDFNTSWIEEWGRTFVETELCGDESLLQYEDYAEIAIQHREMERNALRTANQILISDTDAFVTAFYQKLYEGSVDPLINELIKRRDYDLDIYLTDDVKWVADGMRSMGTDERRNKTRTMFKDMLQEYKITPTIVSGNYSQRLTTVRDLITTKFSQHQYGDH